MTDFSVAEGPFDPDELVRWAEHYGHPEEWAKRAQAAHNRAENLEESGRRKVEQLQAAVADYAEQAEALEVCFDALCQVCEAVVNAHPWRSHEIELAVRKELGVEAALMLDRITKGWRWAEFDTLEPSPAGRKGPR